MIGLTPYDDNQVINDYKAEFGVTNPCAGFEGNSGDAIAKIIDGQQFFGYPTYCVICPDKKLNFDVCSPPDLACFEDYIMSCGATSTGELGDEMSEISVYPNPASDQLYISLSNSFNTKVDLFNAVGEKVKSLEQTTESTIINFSVADLPGGIYILRIESDNNSSNRKISIR